jgi:hypothetical protein
MARRPRRVSESKPKLQTPRFGIGEWYGKSFAALSSSERKQFAEVQFSPDKTAPIPCRFTSRPDKPSHCELKRTKGAICSLRSYQKDESGAVSADPKASSIRATCPNRFVEDGEIYRWIGEVILGDPNAVPVGQTPFLERVPLIGHLEEETKDRKAVGRIDNILVRPGSQPLDWCAVEIQAVYFSGEKMEHLFAAIRDADGGLVFPDRNRRPDYRSSAPKRLLPQLQIKVPTISKWGKKMAVVVDEDFFKSLGRMHEANDLSNSEVVWFVVRFEDNGNEIRLRRGVIFMTTLDDARVGLIAGIAPTKESFEDKILARLASGAEPALAVDEDADEPSSSLDQ